MNQILQKLAFAPLFSVLTISVSACASASNREASPTDTTSSRRASGVSQMTGENSRMLAQDSANGSANGGVLTGDVNKDTSATGSAPLNTSPSAEGGLPAASAATGTTSGAIVQHKKPKAKKKAKKVVPN